MFCRLGVFAGGWTLEAAEAISAEESTCADLLSRLVEQSLVVFGDDPEGKRYHLHETIRQYAQQKLIEAGEEARKSVLKEHNAYFTHLVASQRDALHGMDPQKAIKLIQQDLDNVRQAWQWGVSNHYLGTIRDSVKGLAGFYEMSGLSHEGEQLLAQALSVVEDASDLQPLDRLSLQIDLLIGHASLLLQQAKLETALKQSEKALVLAESLGDTSYIGRACLISAKAHLKNGTLSQGRSDLEAGLVQARQAGDLALEGELLHDLGRTLQKLDERQKSFAYMQQALQIMRTLGNRSQEQAILVYLATNFVDSNDYVTGRKYLEDALQLIQATGNRPLESRIQNVIGFVNAALGALEAALPYHERSRQISQEIGDPLQKSHACHNLCTVNRKLGRMELAEQQGYEALRLAQQNDLGDPTAYAWLHLGYVFRDRGKFLEAAEAFLRSREGFLAQERSVMVIEAIAGLAGTKWKQGEGTSALSLVEQVLDFLAHQPLEGVDEPIQIYLTCYHVLRGLGDDRRAGDVLQQSHNRLMVNAEKIIDPAIRATFLGNVPSHRELMQLWEQRER
jgi:tetratricopeptide (TPR) repeat protein